MKTSQFRVQAFTISEAGFAQYEEQAEFKLVPAKIELYHGTEEEANKIFEGSITTAGDNWFDVPDASTPILVKISNVNYQTYRQTFTSNEYRGKEKLEDFMPLHHIHALYHSLFPILHSPHKVICF